MRAVRDIVLVGVCAVAAVRPCLGDAAGSEAFRTRCGNAGTQPVCDGPSCASCATSCHSTHFVNSGPGTLALEGLPDPYLPGLTYTLRVVLDDPSNPDFAAGGFQLSALSTYDHDGDRDKELCQAGDLAPADAGTRVETDAATSTQWIGHAAPEAASGGTAIWDFLWTAPGPPAGIVEFNLCAVAADGGGSEDADWVYCSEALVFPEVLPCDDLYLDVTASPGPGDCEVTVAWTPSGAAPPVVYDVEVSEDGGPFAPVPGCQGLVDTTQCVHGGATWGRDLVYRVTATDSCEAGPRTATGENAPAVRAGDATAPVLDAPLTAATSQGCDVTVTWDPSGAADACSGVAGFRIYRSDGAATCPSGNRKGELADPAASSFATTVPADGDYFYWVRAVDAAGNEEGNCVTAPVTVSGCVGTCNEMLLDVSAEPGPGDCRATVRWTPTGNEGVTTYDVLWSTRPGGFDPVPGCQGLTDFFSCVHDPAPWGEDLRYRVRATDSCPLGPRTLTTDTLAPVRAGDATPPVFDAPSAAAESSHCGVNVSWDAAAATDACSGVARFRLYRSRGTDTCPVGTQVRETNKGTSTSLSDTVPEIGDWYYWVRAVDAAGNEEANCASVPVVVTGCNVPEPWFLQGYVGRDAPAGLVVLQWSGAADSFDVYRGTLEDVAPIVQATGAYEQVGCRVPGNAVTDDVLGDGRNLFYLVVPVLQSREQGYGCTDTNGDGACDADRLPAALPCP